MQKRIVVLGGVGFIGTHLCLRLLEEGHEVFCVDIRDAVNSPLLRGVLQHPLFRYVHHNIINGFSIRCDEIYNLASPSRVRYNKALPVETLRVSVLGAINTLETARSEHARVVFASAGNIYGIGHRDPASEPGNFCSTHYILYEGKRAAEALHIAQPALTKSVQRLESELGVPLIARKGRGIALTPYGQRLADELQQPLNQLSHIPEMMRQMANQQARTLHVCVLATSDLVTDAAVRFRQTHPDVHFAMTLLPRISDAAHPPYDLLVDSDGMNGDDGFHERILLAVPQSSPLAARTSLCLNDLRGQEFISVMGNRRFREQCSQLCQQSGFMPQYAYECTGPSTVRNLISLGCGVGFWPEYTWGAPGDGIKLLPIDDPRCVRRIVLRCDASGDIRPLAEEFRAALQDELQLLASKKRA